MAIFTPVTDADAVYGEGDWRPLLGDAARKDFQKIYMIGKTSVDHKLRGVILPSFDFTLDTNDQAFGSSVGPCWTNQPQKGLERHFAPNAFAQPLLMYPYMAPDKEHWLSPGNRRNMIGNDTLDADDAMDAFDDLNKWVRRNKQIPQSKKDFLLKAEKLTDDVPIPGRTVRYFALAECRDKENDWHLALIGYTASAQSYLIEQMRWRHQDATAPRDPNWPSYMLGDPTDPAGALEWRVDKVQLDPKDPQETNVMCFTEKREFLDADQKVRKISPEVLAKRVLLVDPKNWNIPTYEEQVEYMMQKFDPAVTADMIRAACSHRCRFEIPRERPESVRLQGGAADSEDRRDRRTERADSEAPAGGSAGLAPRSSAPPMPRDEPTLPVKYWAGRAGGKPTEMTVAELQAVADSGQHEGFKVNMDGKADWQNLSTCGLVTLPAAAPSVPADVAPPTETQAPSVPADVTTPPVNRGPAPQGITLEAMHTKLFPDPDVYQALSPDQQKEADALVQRAWETTDHGTKRDFPADVVSDLMKLLG
jgi:hypothetical protein